ncbi:rhomboid family intramembrane serine protease GlpG [Celerinatantimonas sp. YJH-8]|uniref:rhomboid family intramembrane serine protease GlpG n=1 Tax=Celerinatantimonas sp. YJH-8 TaxID=3228714 RepID=UPI0038C1A1AD
MQQLVVINNPRLAQAFVDYMATLHIECQLSVDHNDVIIWLIDDQHLERARQELEEFVKNPLAPKYQAASWSVGDHKRASIRYHSSTSEIKQRLLSHAGPVTLIMMGVAAIVYVLGILTGGEWLFNGLRFSDSWHQLLEQPWRAVTPILLHFSILHILFNLLWWWELGGVIERRLGSGKLFMILIVAAVIPNMAQFWVSGPYFGGLSGVVYALLGYLWLTGWLRPQLGISINNGIVIFMLAWLVIGFFQVIGPATANQAHLFGLLVGCLQAVFDKVTDKDIS